VERKPLPKDRIFYGLVQKNVLITGANGQLGNELRERKMISNNPFHFIYTDADTLDITDMEQVRRFVDDHNIAYMVNCAAYTNVEKPNPIRKRHCESMLWDLKIWHE